jgi:hypothetical protein
MQEFEVKEDGEEPMEMAELRDMKRQQLMKKASSLGITEIAGKNNIELVVEIYDKLKEK